MILEWTNPWELITPEGTLQFNSPVALGSDDLGIFLLDPSRCSAGSARRVTRNNLPQTDGEISHRKFRTGYVIELNAQLWRDTDEIACDGVLRALGDLLDLHLNAIENADGRLIWTPTPVPGGATLVPRMADKVRALGPSGQSAGGEFVSVIANHDPTSGLVDVTFALNTPLPYVLDAPQTTSAITAGGTLVNGGNADFLPVLKVYGPTNTFTITNTSVVDEQGNPLAVVYDASLPGASSIASGHYAEIDFFRNTIYLDGNSSNLKAGVDVQNSDFFPLVPGANVITVGGGYTGAQIVALWQNAYV